MISPNALLALSEIVVVAVLGHADKAVLGSVKFDRHTG
jgi:hypothetical protein